jgi:ribulose-5-phosphate 4-epimerase/fuculose-1-phosphate aldolase
MRGHGSVIVGGDLPTAVFRAGYSEENARMEATALSLGGPIRRHFRFADLDVFRNVHPRKGNLKPPWLGGFDHERVMWKCLSNKYS